jgi:uncharacterized membrane protein YedE/YeeE
LIETVPTSFTPLPGLVGGVMIGLSAVLLMLSAGKIAGISGILAGGLGPNGEGRSWRLAFLGGLLLPGFALALMGAVPSLTVTASWPILIIAGLLVGYGTRLGSGCTSGHGVCGLARLSGRSLAAVATFMAAGFITVALIRFFLGGF